MNRKVINVKIHKWFKLTWTIYQYLNELPQGIEYEVLVARPCIVTIQNAAPEAGPCPSLTFGRASGNSMDKKSSLNLLFKFNSRDHP
jgi:hypothetical protein